MLYVSTRNPADHHTAYRAMHTSCAPDGGFFVPYRLPVLTKQEIALLPTISPTDAIAKILNLFFGLRLSGWDVECAIGRNPFKMEMVGQRILCAESWRNPAGCWEYLVANLYSLITEGKSNGAMPEGWPYIAVQVSLFFGIYSAMEAVPADGIDVAVSAADFADVVAIGYARDMGLPVKTILFTCNENGAAWELVNKGVFNTGATVINTAIPELDIPHPRYMEYFVFQTLGSVETTRYLACCQQKTAYLIQPEQVKVLRSKYYAAVVSTERAEALQASMLHANRYSADIGTALACGGIQNYRSKTGVSKDTLVLAKRRPKQSKE